MLLLMLSVVALIFCCCCSCCSRTAPAERKMQTAGPPRNLEDEGFYVGNRPYVPNRNLYRMENRLLREIGNIKDEEGAIDNSKNAYNVSVASPLQHITLLV